MSKPKPVGPNERLRRAVFEARMTPEQLARKLDVDPKTVRAWITKGRRPYPVHQFAAAVEIGVPEKELWPDPIRTSGGRVVDERSLGYTAPPPDSDIARAASAISRADAETVAARRRDLHGLGESLANGQRMRESVQNSNRLKEFMSWADTSPQRQEHQDSAGPEQDHYSYSRSNGVESASQTNAFAGLSTNAFAMGNGQQRGMRR